MRISLDDKVCLVTGASQGVGFGIAKCMIEAGAQVFGTGRNGETLKAAGSQLGRSFKAIQADASSKSDVESVARQIAHEAGRLDIVVANAGFSETVSLGAMDEGHLDRVIGTNLKGTILTVQEMLPLMGEGGSVILISSTMAFRGFPGISLYSATKAAVRALARSWIVELKDRRIRVNVVTPGPVETEGMHKMFPDEDEARRFMDGLIQTVPLGRLGRPEDIGNLAVFLSSPAGEFLNGADIQIDGGASQI